jgi:hypothetical protein
MEFWDLLEFTPQIQVLRLCCDSIRDEVLEQLLKVEGGSKLLPHLHRLAIGEDCDMSTKRHKDRFAENKFMHMVRSRVEDEHPPSFNILGEQLLCERLSRLSLCSRLPLSKRSLSELDEIVEVEAS